MYTNGILSSQGTYTLVVQNCIHDHNDKQFINFSQPEDRDMMIESISRDRLELSDNAYDGVGSLYTRN